MLLPNSLLFMLTLLFLFFLLLLMSYFPVQACPFRTGLVPKFSSFHQIPVIVPIVLIEFVQIDFHQAFPVYLHNTFDDEHKSLVLLLHISVLTVVLANINGTNVRLILRIFDAISLILSTELYTTLSFLILLLNILQLPTSFPFTTYTSILQDFNYLTDLVDSLNSLCLVYFV